ncbi:GIY-YIG nuclease family protein [Streptosporangium subroseum]|uniref:GIY-YIG nuclease family protein n=1 Tax=Streptosporangium subroseum TaxID=106412 RepID=UPI0034292B21
MRTPWEPVPRPHALIFSGDAVGLEWRLHAALNHWRVNKVNLRREFFHAMPADVRDLLQKTAGQHLLEYRDTPEALEWHQLVHTKAAAGRAESRT